MIQNHSFKQHRYLIVFLCAAQKATEKITQTGKTEAHVSIFFWCREWAVPLEKHFLQCSPHVHRGADVGQGGLSWSLIYSKILCKVVQSLVPLTQNYSQQRQSYCVWMSTSSYYISEKCQYPASFPTQQTCKFSTWRLINWNHTWVLPFANFFISSSSRIEQSCKPTADATEKESCMRKGWDDGGRRPSGSLY